MVETDTWRLARELVDSIAVSPRKTAAALVGLAGLGCFHPVTALAATVCGAGVLHRRYRGMGRDAFGRTRKEAAAMRERFTLTLGTEAGTGRAVTLSEQEARQHMLVMGTTGSGKTSFLLGLAEQAVAAGSGMIFVDGKGDVSLFAKAFVMARRHGRLDDLLVVNMMTGNADMGGQGGHLLSNTLNPFATGSADILTQLVVGLMDEVGGDGAMWKGRATAMFTGVMKALVWMRDRDGLRLDVHAIRDHIGMGAIVGLATGTACPGLPEGIRAAISSYLTCLPGYNPERGARQAHATLDQHGYLEMQFCKILGSLADVYGHVYRTSLSDIDMQDVVLNRRILVAMLPALEKSGDELANLGKIVVATLKGMMGAALGNRITGEWKDVVDGRVATSDSPFLCILDEVGYYAVEGLALMAAQARSLGFAMVYGAQDLPALRRLNEKEAASVVANTNTTVFMRTVDCDVTTDRSWSPGPPQGAAAHPFRPRRDPRDYAGLAAGEGVVFFKAMEVKARLVHYEPDRLQAGKARIRANYFLSLPVRGANAGAAR